MSAQRYASNLRLSRVSSSSSGARYRTVPTRLFGAMSMELVAISCLTARPSYKHATVLNYTMCGSKIENLKVHRSCQHAKVLNVTFWTSKRSPITCYQMFKSLVLSISN